MNRHVNSSRHVNFVLYNTPTVAVVAHVAPWRLVPRVTKVTRRVFTSATKREVVLQSACTWRPNNMLCVLLFTRGGYVIGKTFNKSDLVVADAGHVRHPGSQRQHVMEEQVPLPRRPDGVAAPKPHDITSDNGG